MAEMRKERGICEYGREEEIEGNMGIWQRGGKRKEYGYMEVMRKDRGIWEYGR